MSILGGILVFLLFVQGGQALLYTLGKSKTEQNIIVNALGRKWEFTFTTLVTFGGAFFASFPLFYSTSFGGAVYVWIAILFCFVIQAVSYEYRRKPSNLFGERTFNAFLLINGFAGPLLLGVAVGTLFFGANFTVDKFNMTEFGGNMIISNWSNPWHGLEAVTEPRNLLLGVAVSMLTMLLGCQFLRNTTDNAAIHERISKVVKPFSLLFLLFFLSFLTALLLADGYAVDSQGVIFIEKYKYTNNLLQMPLVTSLMLVGVLSVLWSICLSWRSRRSAIWFGGAGTALTVTALLLLAGWNNTAYYPSLTDMQSSLTIYNSSSSLFTLKTMSVVSLAIPFVIAYIWYAWRALTRKPIDAQEIENDDHAY